ncbi:MAG: CPBP family intramembrane metalloprotease [Paludibacter sp.]|nr:CPBP family intramembrane metalloprotease [Paludibacter sp.]
MNLLKNSFARSGLFGKLILLIFVVFFGMFLVSGAFVVCEKLHWINSENPDDLLIIQAGAMFLSFIIPAFIVAYLCSEDVACFLFLKKKSQLFEITAVIGILILALPFINLLTSLNESLAQIPFFDQLFSASEAKQRAAAEQMIGANFWGAMAVVALGAAVAEELMFRGAVLRLLSEKTNLHAAVWLSAAAFSLIHLQFFGFVPRIVLGAYFAYIVIFSNNIRLSMWAHFFNNAMIILVQHFSENQTIPKTLDTFGSSSTWIAGIVSGILSVCTTIYLIKYWKKSQ